MHDVHIRIYRKIPDALRPAQSESIILVHSISIIAKFIFMMAYVSNTVL